MGDFSKFLKEPKVKNLNSHYKRAQIKYLFQSEGIFKILGVEI